MNHQRIAPVFEMLRLERNHAITSLAWPRPVDAALDGQRSGRPAGGLVKPLQARRRLVGRRLDLVDLDAHLALIGAAAVLVPRRRRNRVAVRR